MIIPVNDPPCGSMCSPAPAEVVMLDQWVHVGVAQAINRLLLPKKYSYSSHITSDVLNVFSMVSHSGDIMAQVNKTF